MKVHIAAGVKDEPVDLYQDLRRQKTRLGYHAAMRQRCCGLSLALLYQLVI